MQRFTHYCHVRYSFRCRSGLRICPAVPFRRPQRAFWQQLSHAGSPTELFEHPGLRNSFNIPNYDVSLDGQRFILPEPVGYEETEAPQVTIRVVENWYEEFRDREQD